MKIPFPNAADVAFKMGQAFGSICIIGGILILLGAICEMMGRIQ